MMIHTQLCQSALFYAQESTGHPGIGQRDSEVVSPAQRKDRRYIATAHLVTSSLSSITVMKARSC
jgi:hypothetical protein